MIWSRKPLIFLQNPLSDPNVISLGFWQGFDLVDFETLYLEAQMKLEGVLGLKVQLRELVRPLG